LNKGGGEKIVPQFDSSKQKGSPFITNEEKFKNQQTQNKYVQNKPNLEKEPFFKMELNYPQMQPPKKPLDVTKFQPPIIIPPMYNQSLYQQPIIHKSYSVNINGLLGQPGMIKEIYEDMLPSNLLHVSYSTIGERSSLEDYIKSIMFPHGDGRTIDLSGKDPNNIFNRIKFMELNPYYRYKFNKNPYRGLPKGLIKYRSCWPIKHQSLNGSTTCSENSTGILVSIYELKEDEYKITKQIEKKLYDYDIWREIAYKEYIREHIIKNNISPNFVILYGFHITKNSGIDFNKIEITKDSKTGYNQFGDQDKKINVNIINNINLNNILNCKCDDMQKKNESNVLVALTEAPNNNLFGWASKTYSVIGNIKTQISTGFYSSKVWYSIIFQIMIIFLVLQNHNILFNNYNIEDNIFIKDLGLQGNITKYWKYKINGLDFYVPNYGYLVQFDSNYKDNENKSIVLNNKKQKFKINSTIFDDTENYQDQIFQQFSRTINTNIFSDNFTEFGGVKPPSDILNLLNKMMDEYSKKKEVSYYIINFMTLYLNNRIGSPLKEIEIDKINKLNKNFNIGDLLVHEYENDTYKFVLYLETKDGQSTVLTKNDKKSAINKQTFPVSELYPYSQLETVQQNYDIEKVNLNDDELLETYIINDDINHFY
jgi:hypothetical protein